MGFWHLQPNTAVIQGRQHLAERLVYSHDGARSYAGLHRCELAEEDFIAEEKDETSTFHAQDELVVQYL